MIKTEVDGRSVTLACPLGVLEAIEHAGEPNLMEAFEKIGRLNLPLIRVALNGALRYGREEDPASPDWTAESVIAAFGMSTAAALARVALATAFRTDEGEDDAPGKLEAATGSSGSGSS